MMCAFLSFNTEHLLILLYVEKIVDWIIKETSRSSCSWKRTRSGSFSTSHGNLNSVASRIFPKQHTWHPPCLRERIKINQFQNLNIQTRLWSFDTVLFFTILVDSLGVIWHWGGHFFSLIWFMFKCFHKWYLELKCVRYSTVHPVFTDWAIIMSTFHRKDYDTFISFERLKLS